MSDPVRASDTPYPIEVTAGKTYYWCSCGQSKKQPFCDSSHKGSAFVPLAYQATKTGKVYFCGCKATGKQPLCDGTHGKKL